MLVRLDPTDRLHGHREPERDLWNAVIQQAWDDYFSRGALVMEIPEGARQANGKLPIEVKRELSNEAKKNRNEAHGFLFDSVGGWAARRAEVCALAGMDPDWLREQALKKARERR